MIRSLRVRAVRSSTTKTHPTSTVVSVRQTSLSECAVSATTRTQEAYTHLLKPHHTRTFCVHLSSLLISYITKCTKTQNTKQLQKHIQHINTPPLFAGSLCVTRSTKSQNTKQPQKHIQHINTPPLFAGSLCLNVQLAQLCPSAAAPPAIPRTDKNLCKKHLLDISVFDVHDSHDSVPLQLLHLQFQEQTKICVKSTCWIFSFLMCMTRTTLSLCS